MTTETRKEFEALSKDVAELRKDLRSLLEAVGGDSKDRLQDIRQRMSERWQHRVEQVRSGVEQAKDYGRQAVDQTRQTVSDHPLTTVLAAVGIGTLLGLALGRRG